jgi:co-chaperonin GroES (HSP10)
MELKNILIKIGDSVLYGKYAGTELKLEGKII